MPHKRHTRTHTLHATGCMVVRIWYLTAGDCMCSTHVKKTRHTHMQKRQVLWVYVCDSWSFVCAPQAHTAHTPHAVHTAHSSLKVHTTHSAHTAHQHTQHIHRTCSTYSTYIDGTCCGTYSTYSKYYSTYHPYTGRSV